MRYTGFLIMLVCFLPLSMLATLDAVEVNQEYVTSWFGNTFGGPDQAVPYTTKSILLTSEGKVLINTRSSEQVRVHQVYGPDGSWLAKYDPEKKGGNAICSDGTYFYYNNDKAENLTKARLSDYAKDIRVELSDIDELVGMACTGGRLYMCDQGAGTIHIHKTSDLSHTGNLDISGEIDTPGRIAADRSGNVWVIDVEDNTVHCYNPLGAHVPGRMIDSVDRPEALAVDDSRNLLFVADNGPDYNIKAFDISKTPPSVSETIGVVGGAYQGKTTRGKLGPLHFNGIYAMSANASGNLAVNCGGTNVWRGTEIRWINRNGDTWEETALVRGDHFVDGGDIDDGDETAIHSMDLKYEMDYSKPAGRQWKAVAVTADPFSFPHDPRNHEGNKVIGITIRRVQGHKFMYASSEDNRYLMIYRFDPENFGEIAIPCGLVAGTYVERMAGIWGDKQPVTAGNKQRWSWVDSNGDGHIGSNETRLLGSSGAGSGYFVDKNGTIWTATEEKRDGKRSQIHEYSLDPNNGVSANGVPLYTSPPRKTFNASPMRRLSYVTYDPDRDIMIQFGETDDKSFTSGFDLPRAAARYDNWSTGHPTLVWLNDSFRTEGLFAIKHCYHEEDYVLAGQRSGHIQVHRVSDGKQVLTLKAGPEVEYTAGKLDKGPALLRAQKRTNGEYLFVVEEDGYCKLLLYQWTPFKGAACPPCHHNGVIDFCDFALFAQWWLDRAPADLNWCGAADFSTNGRVDFSDLETFASVWLRGY